LATYTNDSQEVVYFSIKQAGAEAVNKGGEEKECVNPLIFSLLPFLNPSVTSLGSPMNLSANIITKRKREKIESVLPRVETRLEVEKESVYSATLRA